MLSRLTTVKKVGSGVLIKNRTELQELFGVLSYEVRVASDRHLVLHVFDPLSKSYDSSYCCCFEVKPV